jgi:hypothetical protein
MLTSDRLARIGKLAESLGWTPHRCGNCNPEPPDEPYGRTEYCLVCGGVGFMLVPPNGMALTYEQFGKAWAEKL